MSNIPRKVLEDPATDAGDFLVRVGLALLAIVVPVSVIVSRRALFTLIPVGVALVLIGGMLLPHIKVPGRLRAMGRSLPGLSGAALLAWCTLSLVWTPFPADAAERLWKLGGTVALVALTVALLPERTRTSNLYLFPLGLALASAATFGVMIMTPSGFMNAQPEASNPERAAISLVVLVWPCIGALAIRDRWIAAALLAVAVTVAAISAWTSIALAALALGALTFTAATFNPQRVSQSLGILAAALLVAAPVIPFLIAGPVDGLAARFGAVNPAIQDVGASIQNWRAVIDADPVRLVTGHGFDITSRALTSQLIPAPAPRSILFEIWFELGMVGAVTAAIFASAAFAAAGRASAIVAPFLLAELVAGATVTIWGTDTTQLWWVTFAGVATIAFIHVVRGQYRIDRPAIDAIRQPAE